MDLATINTLNHLYVLLIAQTIWAIVITAAVTYLFIKTALRKE